MPAQSTLNLSDCLQLSEEELFIMLAPPQQGWELGNKGQRISRGKEIFREVLRQSRSTICEHYSKNKEVVKGTVDLGNLVLLAMTHSVTLAGISLVPAAAIIVKIGLAKVCGEGKGTP